MPQARIPSAFDAASGEIHASIRTLLAEQGQTLRNTLLSRLRDAQDGAVWGRLFGTWGSIDGDGNAVQFDTNFSGLTFGADVPLDSDFRAGVEAGYGQGAGFIGEDRNSSLTTDSFHGGLYGDYRDGRLSFDAGAIGSWGTVRTERAIRFGTFLDNDHAKQSSRILQAFGEASYNLLLQSVDFAPFVNGGWIESTTGGFTETGGAAALAGGRATSDENYITLGTRITTDFTLSGGGDIAPAATIGWLHGFHTLLPSQTQSFIAGGAGFTVFGVPLDEDQAVIDVGFTAHPTTGAAMTLGYEGIVSRRISDNGLHLGVTWDF